MTKEEAKQKAIKKAWGKYWNWMGKLREEALLNKGIINARWFDIDQDEVGNIEVDEDFLCYWQSNIHKIIPKCLISLEDNNGWTRIEPDGSNLPIDENRLKQYKVIDDSGLIHITTLALLVAGLKLLRITHYKPIEKELLPIY